VTRILSGAVLLVLAVALVWFASSLIFFIVALALLLVAFGEYASLARANGIQVPEAPAALGAALTAATFSRTAFSVPWLSIDIVLLVSLIGLSLFAMVRWDGGSGALALVSASLFP
jgi:CDP-diglyceride synthetase